MGTGFLTPSLQAKERAEEMGAGGPDCGVNCDLSFHSLCLGLSVCKSEQSEFEGCVWYR